MALNMDALVRLRPRLFHLTAEENVGRILREGQINSAASLFESAERRDRLRVRRRKGEWVTVNGERVHVRDQAPLHPGSMALSDGWTYDGFVEHVNRHVFFWPGTSRGPIPYGVRHFERYSNEGAVVISVSLDEVRRANPGRDPLVCRYNSGSPRCSGGQRSPRGIDTYVPLDQFPGAAGDVVEVVFRDCVWLPVEAITRHDPREFVRQAG